MALVIPVGFGSVVLSHVRTGDPDPYAVTFGVDLSAMGGDFQLAANTIFGAWVAMAGIYDDQVLLEKVVLYVGQDGDPPLVVESDLPSESGTGAGNYLPQNNACLVTKLTGVPGRRNKGRNYWPYILPEGEVDDTGSISGAHVDGLQANFDGFLEDLAEGVNEVPMVLLHGPGVSSTPPPTLVTSLRVETIIATQRLRLRK